MDTDDIAPPPAAKPPAALDTLSITELEARIAALEAEILRIRETIAAKRQARGAAEGMFGKPA